MLFFLFYSESSALVIKYYLYNELFSGTSWAIDQGQTHPRVYYVCLNIHVCYLYLEDGRQPTPRILDSGMSETECTSETMYDDTSPIDSPTNTGTPRESQTTSEMPQNYYTSVLRHDDASVTRSPTICKILSCQ